MTEASNPARSRNRTTLFLIAAVFVAPIVLAWLFATGTVGLGDRARTNHGQLITPPVDLRTLPPPQGAAALLKLQPADWAVVYISAGACDESCGQHLQALEVVRSLSGKEATRLSVFGLSAEEGAPPALPLHAFVDWRGQLMMTFPTDAPPADIKSDLVRLLRASAIR